MTGSRDTIWRVLETAPARGSWNMAVDEVLLESVRLGGAPTLRFYRWAPACLSLGRNQVLPSGLEGRLARIGAELVRRPTGGRGVLHDVELTYSVAAATGALGPPRRAYREINEVLVEGINRLGAAAVLQQGPGNPARIDGETPCFADPVEGEVLSAGRKLIGSAQVRLGGHLLQHGSLPLRPSTLSATSADGLAEHIGAPAYLESLVDPLPQPRRIIDAIVAAWEERIGPVEWSVLTPSELERARAVRLHYRSGAWTHRR